MGDTVTLVGLDFGTTTSSAAIATAKLTCNAATGRMELVSVEPLSRCEQVFTPFCGDRLDEVKLAGYLEQWLAEIRPGEVFGGGAMITGLAAQAANAAELAGKIRQHIKDAVIAVAADPCLESWLAFMGNCWELSRETSDQVFVNLDIGGGTTNIASGRGGEVLRTGSFFVGARHVRFEPGSYRIAALSSYAGQLLQHLGIHKTTGDCLAEADVRKIVDWYVLLLERTVTGAWSGEIDALTALHVQAPFDAGPSIANCAVTLSGGVGQVAYRGLQSGAWPGITAYGDLGVDIARRLVQRPFWRDQLTRWSPTGLGRATLFGLLRHNTQVSGSTVYLSEKQLLPLRDLAILGSVSPATPPDELGRLLALAVRTSRGGCLKVDFESCDQSSIRGFAEQLRQALARQPTIEGIPLVLLVRENLGKVLGQLVTNWGRAPAKIIVIDEIDARDSQFACIGRLQQGVLPVSFHGMNARGGFS